MYSFVLATFQIIKSDSYLGLDHSETFNVDIAGKEVLPEFKPHKKDVGLDKEPTMFDLMNGLDNMEEENDDFDDDEDDDMDMEPPAKMSKAKIVPKGETKQKEEKTELEGDDDDFVIAD